MKRWWKSGQLSTILLGTAVVVFTIALVIYPKQSVEAGLVGLKLFWDVVFPSLLPFFILSELMLGLGIVRGFGVLLEPLMRPLFSVPGVGAFALSMGLAAGYPMDAVVTARFRETGMCTQVEGERLLAFTNTADPLFMFGAVAVGMFKSPELGALLAVAHYVSSFLVGVSFKLWGRRGETIRTEATRGRGNILLRAYREMMKAREEDGRTFGKLLGTAVTESIQTLLMICGFIVFFAVLIEILNLSGLMRIIGWPIAFVYQLFGLDPSLVGPTMAGLLEIDIGTAQTAAASAPMLQKFALVSAIIAWSGLAVHAQVASVLTQTDIRMTPYFLARFLHAALAAVLTVVFWHLGVGRPVAQMLTDKVPVFAAFQSASSGSPWVVTMWNGLTAWVWLIVGLLVLSAAWATIRRLRLLVWRTR
ncbi:sporulation integral membrane protein YlbJ [Alicyclobacillus herbarius]|uniref:sporulation integral membrane protein YlbJ n=1 Tax=Alicyclobacillus herbarius TaxID=122960 RepID=UPI0004026C26|nr:sporulation integral membrane protein YlbJ [Alicyclobacillus herbarius]